MKTNDCASSLLFSACCFIFGLSYFFLCSFLTLPPPFFFTFTHSSSSRTPPLHLNAFGSVVPPPYCVKVCFLTAIYHYCFSSCLHSISQVYIFLVPPVHDTYLGHMRGPVSAVSNEHAQMGMLFSRWVTRKRGQCHCHIDVPTNVVVRQSRALHFSSTPPPSSRVRKPLAIPWQGGWPRLYELSVHPVGRSPWRHSGDWRSCAAEVWASCEIHFADTSSQQYVNLALLMNSSPPFFVTRHGAVKAPFMMSQRVLMPLQLCNANKIWKQK